MEGTGDRLYATDRRGVTDTPRIWGRHKKTPTSSDRNREWQFSMDKQIFYALIHCGCTEKKNAYG